MGISSMPAPRDSLLGCLVWNAVISVAALAGLVRAALVFLDLQAALPGEDDLLTPSPSSPAPAGPGLAERLQLLRAAIATTACGADAGDCSVCLAALERGAPVKRLPCGHLFHGRCVETWLRYDRATCPLCRARVPLLLPADAAAAPVLE